MIVTEAETNKPSWLLILCLMRNIFCHEVSFRWETCAQLAAFVVDTFGSLDELWDLVIIYHRLVGGGGNLVEKDRNEYRQDILMFSHLIPLRTNNSLLGNISDFLTHRIHI